MHDRHLSAAAEITAAHGDGDGLEATDDSSPANAGRVSGAAIQRPLFLRWTLVNTLTGVAFAAALLSYDGHVHTVGRVTAGVVLAVFALASGYCGLLAWRADDDADGRAHARELEHVALAIRVCPMIAMDGVGVPDRVRRLGGRRPAAGQWGVNGHRCDGRRRRLHDRPDASEAPAR